MLHVSNVNNVHVLARERPVCDETGAFIDSSLHQRPFAGHSVFAEGLAISDGDYCMYIGASFCSFGSSTLQTENGHD